MTALSSAIDSAWLSNVWQNATILGYTDKILQRPIGTDSERELQDIRFEQYINCIEALTTRQVARGTTNVTYYEFKVEVTYYRKKDPQGLNWSEVRDFFEDLYSTVNSSLGSTWGGTVDFWRAQTEPAQITEFTLDKEAVWKGNFSYTGFSKA